MMRAFNAREGFTAADEVLSKKGHSALRGGATDGVAVTHDEFFAARELYYQMAGWDQNGVPTAGKLAELELEWVAELLESAKA